MNQKFAAAGAVTLLGLILILLHLIGTAMEDADKIRRHLPHPKPHPQPQPRPEPRPEPDPFSSVQRELLRLHNAERAKHGLPPLELDPKLCRSASTHADWMAAHGRLTHNGDDSPFERIESAGYRWSNAGENIAWNQQTAEEVVKAWMSDWGHRRNILGNFTHLGAAVAYGKDHDPYWCCDFGTPAGSGAGAAVATPPPVTTGLKQ